jgi:ATP-binding cassette subfamily B protein
LLLLFGLNIISSAATLAQPYFTKLIIDDAWLRRDTRNLWILACWMLFSAALSIVLGMVVTQVYIRLSAKVLFEMRLEAYRKIQSLSPQYFARTKTGDIVSRINNDIGELQRLSSDTLLSVASNVLFLIGSAVLMLWLNARLFVFSVAAVTLIIWAMRRYQGRLRTQIGRIREQSASIGSFLIESILGMRVVVSNNAQLREQNRFGRLNDDYVATLLAMQKTSFLAGSLPGAVLTLSTAALFLYGGYMVIGGTLSIGSLVAYVAYHTRLLSPVGSLMGTYSALIMGSVSLGRVFELLDTPVEVSDSANAAPIGRGSGAISFNRVSFVYGGRAAPALDGVTFEVAPGQVCVLAGASGSGKSTLADLAVRFYDPSEGAVLLDGHDLRTLRLEDVRQAICTVEQSPFFFHASLRDNLRFAAPAATEDDLWVALGRANLGAFVRSLEAGLETIMGERGLALSVGQRQRLAIARALLRKPAVLVLDEPSAALDPEAELELALQLRQLSGECTILISTHRPALLQVADVGVVMERGKVVEWGPAAELLGRDSLLTRHFQPQGQATTEAH